MNPVYSAESERAFGVIILAAGKGTRMESDLIKVLHPVAGQPLLSYVFDTARQLHPSKMATVVGYQSDTVRQVYQQYKDISWVIQTEMKGTGDAVARTLSLFSGFQGPILVLYGDIPGIRVETLRRLRMMHDTQGHTITMLTADLEDPAGYGRVIVRADGTISKIIEDKDATLEEKEISEVNTGIGIYEPNFLFDAVQRLKPNNKQGELYLTDVVSDARSHGKTVGRMLLKEATEALGINTRTHLADVARFFFDEKANTLLEQGVSLEDPACVAVEPKVKIDRDTEIRGQVSIRGDTVIGRGCRIDTGVVVENSFLEDNVGLSPNVILNHVHLGEGSVIGANTVIGYKE